MASRHSIVFPLRLRPRDAEVIERASAALDITRSEFLRRAAVAEARRQLANSAAAPADVVPTSIF
jgi:uncharacterized protein (DUF1778 family)